MNSIHFFLAPGSKIGLTETKLAIIPAAGGTQRLVRTVGPAVAKELIFTARVVTGAEAEKLGIVNQCVENSYEKALEIARQIKERVGLSVFVFTKQFRDLLLSEWLKLRSIPARRWIYPVVLSSSSSVMPKSFRRKIE